MKVSATKTMLRLTCGRLGHFETLAFRKTTPVESPRSSWTSCHLGHHVVEGVDRNPNAE